MATPRAKEKDFEQIREAVNILRFLGGLLLMVALLLYFFHLAEIPAGHHVIGIGAAVFAIVGVALFWVGQHKIRALR